MGYIFDPQTIHEVGLTALNLPTEEMVRVLTDGLKQAYPDYIDTDQEFIFSQFGSTTSMMKILHASVSEYVIIFGTPMGTRGFSGRFLIEVWDTVVRGKMWTFTEDNPLHLVTDEPGAHAYLPWLRSKGWGLTQDGWLLEYGRGILPAALPFGIADAATTNLDPITVAKTLWIFGKLSAKNLLRHGKI